MAQHFASCVLVILRTGDVESGKVGCVHSEECNCWCDCVGKHMAGVDVQMAQQREVSSGWVVRYRLKWDANTHWIEAEG